MSRFEKTILQVVPRLDAGGAERTTLEIAEAVVRAGGRALVVSAGGRLEKDIQNAGGEILHAPVASKNPLTVWANAACLAAIIRQEGVNLIHARSRAPAWSALAAARRTGVPFVTTYHGAYSAAGKLKAFYNSSMLRGDRVIANSRFTAERIMELGGIEPGRIAVIPRGVDVNLFDPKKVFPHRIRQATAGWGLGENPGFKLLMPARISPWKGHEVAIAALAKLKGRYGAPGATGQGAGLTLVFCGGAQGRDRLVKRLRAVSEESGVHAMVHFVGDCADMPAAYAWADAVLSPSTEPEAFGRVIVEAGAMQKPVVASRHGGARETVIDRQTGFLAAPGDAKALAAAIEQVLMMVPPARQAMGEKARERAVSLFSSAAMCDATLGVYRSLLAERA